MPSAARILEFFTGRSGSAPEAQALSSQAVTSGSQPEDLKKLKDLLSKIPTGREPIEAWATECSTLIDKLLLSRIPTSDLASVLAGLVSYQATGVTALHSHLALVRAFGSTSGLFQEVLHYSLFPRQTVSPPPAAATHFDNLTVAQRNSALNELRDTGYAVLPVRLNSSTLQRLRDEVAALPFALQDRRAADVPQHVDAIDPASPPACGAAHANERNLLARPVFGDLANDPALVSLVSEYLETSASAIDAVLWYSFPSQTASSELAQLFHYDLDTIRWVKAFFYLSDVTDANGPHQYVAGSHVSGAKSQDLLERGYVRISDSDMAESQSGSVRSITGPAGTIILGDTRAFHKGARVQAGYRLIFSPIYAASKISYIHGLD